MPANPEVSLIIPIYKSYELVRHQFMEFAQDGYLKQQDIILVLDSPEDAHWFTVLMQRLWDLYGVPCRVVIMNRNGGFGLASNAGAESARAPYLLMLNSDIFPQRTGWLERMVATLQRDPLVGAVSALLLYPDESIQHAGMTWRRETAFKNLLINHHPFKGIDRALLPLKGEITVPAVTAACLLCRAEEFRQLGMFDSHYIQGDFEDSDLCLKFIRDGRRIVCNLDAVLYHLEGNSYPSERRRQVFLINALRHEERWSEDIHAAVHNLFPDSNGEDPMACFRIAP